MKKRLVILIVLFISAITLLNKCSDTEEFKLCVQKCPSSQPWRVETLDLDRPCFATKDECLEWAENNGYSNVDCVKCN